MPNGATRTALTASAPAGSLRKPQPFTGIRVHAVVDPRRPHRDRARTGQHVTLVVIAVAHHEPAAVLIDLIDELFHIRCNRGLQRRGQHLPSAVADDLIKQRPRRSRVVVRRSGVVNYREHGRTFRNQRVNAALDQSYWTFRSSSGRCAHLRGLAEGHPQILIIAP
jgi:hypothetical protein